MQTEFRRSPGLMLADVMTRLATRGCKMMLLFCRQGWIYFQSVCFEVERGKVV